MMLGLAGGALIGLAAALLWLLNGQIAGVSGIARGALFARSGERAWRSAFLLGLVAGGALMSRTLPDSVSASPVSFGSLLLAGLLVGVGTALADGCTSGHGVCGIGRLAPRSLVATAVFVAVGMVVVRLTHHALAGAS